MLGTEPARAGAAAVPDYASLVIEGLREAGVTIVTFLPESLLKGVYRRLPHEDGIRTIRVSNEAEMPGIVAGAYLGGTRGIMIMENSGIRQACEPIARFTLTHQMPLVMILAYRGDLGERNWWGHAHGQTMVPILDALRIRHHSVSRIADIKPSITKAFVHADAGQCGVALIFSGECIEGAANVPA